MTVKRDVQRNVEYLVLDENGDAPVFRAFVMHLIECGTLREDDIFVVDNCSIHFNGENSCLRDHLWNEFHIKMVPLPPYYPELNPTEFVFGHLVHQLKRKYVRQKAQTDEDFVGMIEETVDEIEWSTVFGEYKHCGYIHE